VDPGVAILAGVSVVLLVGWIASIGTTVLRFFEFRLTQDGSDLRRQHGLLSRSSGIIPLKRVQAVRVERPFMRRLFHRASIVADSAGSVTAATDTGTGVIAPIIRDAEIPALLARVLVMDDPLGHRLMAVSPLAVRRGFIRVALPIVVVAGVAALALQPVWGAAVVPTVALAYVWARARYRAIGYDVDDDLVVAQSGIVTQRQWFVPTAKVQSAVIRSSVFQRRLGLATLSIDTAGPGTRKVTIIDLEREMAEHLAGRLSTVSAEFGLVSDGV
jgi:putative membrane protein